MDRREHALGWTFDRLDVYGERRTVRGRRPRTCRMAHLNGPGAGVPGVSAADGSGAGNGAGQGGNEISTPLLAFTYFYACSIYILLLSFYFWLWRTDIKPVK